MKSRINFGGVIAVGAASIWCALFVGGLINYPGRNLVYVSFSAVFLLLLTSGLYRPRSYGYLFLTVFLWLGFWLKLVVHLIFSYAYREPIGRFEEHPDAMDGVLVVAIAAAIGVIAGRILYSMLRRKPTTEVPEQTLCVPIWYPTTRRWLWLVLIVAIVGVAVGNAVYGIQQSGLVPRAILPWPLNAGIYWLLSTGFAMAVVTLFYWDRLLGRSITAGMHGVFAEAFFSTVSILSRGTYIFHAMPAVVASLFNYRVFRGYSTASVVVLVATFGILFLVSLSAVTALRNYYYSADPAAAEAGMAEIAVAGLSGITGTLSGLVVDRWVGLEGVMAVHSFPGKSLALFYSAAMERPAIGKATLYQEVCRSHYRTMDMNKYQFASLPGAAAFFYYTGSEWVVVGGMLLVTIVALLAEGAVFLVFRNPFLCSLFGMNVANAIAQLGVAPRQLAIHFFMTFVGMTVIWVIQVSGIRKADLRAQS